MWIRFLITLVILAVALIDTARADALRGGIQIELGAQRNLGSSTKKKPGDASEIVDLDNVVGGKDGEEAFFAKATGESVGKNEPAVSGKGSGSSSTGYKKPVTSEVVDKEEVVEEEKKSNSKGNILSAVASKVFEAVAGADDKKSSDRDESQSETGKDVKKVLNKSIDTDALNSLKHVSVVHEESGGKQSGVEHIVPWSKITLDLSDMTSYEGLLIFTNSLLVEVLSLRDRVDALEKARGVVGAPVRTSLESAEEKEEEENEPNAGETTEEAEVIPEKVSSKTEAAEEGDEKEKAEQPVLVSKISGKKTSSKMLDTDSSDAETPVQSRSKSSSGPQILDSENELRPLKSSSGMDEELEANSSSEPKISSKTISKSKVPAEIVDIDSDSRVKPPKSSSSSSRQVSSQIVDSESENLVEPYKSSSKSSSKATVKIQDPDNESVNKRSNVDAEAPATTEAVPVKSTNSFLEKKLKQKGEKEGNVAPTVDGEDSAPVVPVKSTNSFLEKKLKEKEAAQSSQE